jgi:hypothetical protein
MNFHAFNINMNININFRRFFAAVKLLTLLRRASVYFGAPGSVVGRGTMLQAGRSWVRFPMRSWNFFNLPNPFSRTVALGSTQPLTEMSNRMIPGGVKRGRRVRLTTLQPSVSRCLENVVASTSHNPMGLHGLLQG